VDLLRRVDVNPRLAFGNKTMKCLASPKGSRPPMMLMTVGLRYHFFSGMGRGIVFTRHGLSGTPSHKARHQVSLNSIQSLGM
jgi:hypothetical protein